MKKSTKGIIATGVGVALLTGVGGTFAEWRQSEQVPGGTVTAGHLDMTVAAGSWSDVTGATAVPITTIGDFRMVPGDKLEYSTTITPDLVGNNLEATLTATVTSPTGSLVDDVDIVADVNSSSTPTMQLTPANTAAIPVTVTITMPFNDDTLGTEGEDETLDLSSLTLDLVQNPNPGP